MRLALAISTTEILTDLKTDLVVANNNRVGSQVFALRMSFLCVILHNMCSGKILQLLCILPFGMLCLSAISIMFVKIMLEVCMFVGMVV